MFRPRSKWPTLAALVLLAAACRGVGESRDAHPLTLNGTSVHIRPAGYVHAPILIDWDAANRTFKITPPSGVAVRVSATFNSEPLTLTPEKVNTVRFDWGDDGLEWTATNYSGVTRTANSVYVSTPRRAPYLRTYTSTLTTKTSRLYVYFNGYRTSFYVTQQFSSPPP